MSSRPVITIRDDKVTIDGDYLAEKLGLSTDRLRVEMRGGIVYGLVVSGARTARSEPIDAATRQRSSLS